LIRSRCHLSRILVMSGDKLF